MKVLLLESDENFAKTIIEALKIYSISIYWFQRVEDAIKSMGDGNLYITYILEQSSKNNGVELIKFIRKYSSTVPILLTSEEYNNSVFEKCKLCECNDFMRRPFLIEELRFRLNRLFNIDFAEAYTLKEGVIFNIVDSTLSIDDKIITLGVKEKKLLEIIVQRNPSMATFNQIEYHVWDNEIVDVLKIRSLVSQLRSKLPIDLIQTVKGVGYRLRSDI